MATAFEFVKQVGSISEYRLKSNGMTVLLYPKQSGTPVATFNVTYRVGSRNESAGNTGATHFLEHLMFKGSTEFNKEKGTSIWSTLQKTGAQLNATTSNDRTNYFSTLPTKDLELAIRIEADRMRGAFLRNEDRDSEMTVVRNEFERGANNPVQELSKAVWSTAFTSHPYHHPTIGWLSDVENVPIERLRLFYDTFYHPNNATAIVVGEFDPLQTLDLLATHFGRVPRSPEPIPQMYTQEREQEGPRTTTIERAGRQAIVALAYKSPPATDEDAYPLQVFDSLMSQGKNSRLYKRLVDSGLASGASTSSSLLRDEGLSKTYVFLNKGTQPDRVLKELIDEYERVKESGVTDEEVELAKRRIRTQTLLERDASVDVMFGINEAVASGNWELYPTYLDEIDKVTPQRVQEAARRYFVERRQTVGIFLPSEEPSVENPFSLEQLEQRQTPLDQDARALGDGPSGVALAPSDLEFRPLAPSIDQRSLLDSGVRLLTLPTEVTEIVTLTGSLPAGTEYSRDNRVLATMTAFMLDEGTTTRSKFQIARELDEIGASIRFSVGDYRVSFSARFLRADLPKVVELLADQLQNPLFGEKEYALVQQRVRTSLNRQREDVNVRADVALSRAIYPEGHPNRAMSVDEELELLDDVTVERMREFHRTTYGLGTEFTVVATGEVDPDELQRELEQRFAQWQRADQITVPPADVQFERAQKRRSLQKIDIDMKDKMSNTLLVGQPLGIDERDDDYIALTTGVFILGGNFSARLMQVVRDKMGLTYGIRAHAKGAESGKDGFFEIRGTFKNTLLRKGRTATLEQLQKWYKDGVTQKELDEKKSTIIGSYRLGMETTSGLASRILDVVEQQRPLGYLDEFVQRVEALTVQTVNAAIRKHLSLDATVLVRAGTPLKRTKE